jgi:hypothetical protein
MLYGNYSLQCPHNSSSFRVKSAKKGLFEGQTKRLLSALQPLIARIAHIRAPVRALAVIHVGQLGEKGT